MSQAVRKTILLVEDEALLAMNAKMQLEKYGYAVSTVNTGEKAVEAVQASSGIDLILMDINLGTGIDGTQAAEIILLDRDIPIVFLSSHTDPEVVEKTEKITSYGYVVKNSNIAVLDASIKMAFKLFDAKVEVKNHRNMLSEINRIGILANSTLELDAVLQSVLEETVRALGTSEGMIFLNNPESRTLTWGASVGLSQAFVEEFSTKPIRMGEGLTGRIAETGKPVFISEDSSHDSRIERAVIDQEAFESFIGVPIFADDRVVGVMNILTRPPSRLTEDNVDFCSAIGVQVGSAIRNARIYTQQRRVADELIEARTTAKKSEAKWRSYIENAPDGVFVTDENGVFIEVNKAACRITGYSEDELLEFTVLSLIQEEYLEKAKSHFQTVARDGFASAEFGAITKSGERRFWNVDAVKLSETRCLGFVKDITEHTNAKTALIEAKNNFQTIVQLTGDIIVQVDAEGHWKFLNDNACAFWGGTWEELQLQSYVDYVHPDDQEKAHSDFMEMIETGKIKRNTVNRQKTPEGWRVVQWNTVPMFDEGIYIGFQATGRDITDRKQSEEELRRANDELLKAKEKAQESEAQTRYILKHTPNAIAVFDNEMNILMVSDRFLDDYNVKNKDVIGKNHYQVFPEIPERWRTIHARALQGETLGNDDDYFVRPDGSITYTRWECRPWYRSDDSIGGIIAYTEVTTERQQAEEALQQERNLLRSIIEIIPDPIFVKDTKARKLIVNRADCVRCGFKNTEDLIGKDDFDFFPPEIAQSSFDDDQRVLKHGESVVNEERKSILPNGEPVWELTTKLPKYDQQGKIIGLVGISRNITDRKNLEDSLKASEQKWRALVENNPDFIAIHDEKGRFLFLNRYAEGYSEDEILGTSAYEYMPEESKRLFQEKEKECLEKWVIQKFEHRAVGENGMLFWYENFLIPFVEDETGKRVIVVSRDITERKNAEQETQKQLTQKETLLREVHHRVKNNMATIESLLSLQIGDSASPEVKAELQETISRVQSIRVLYERLLISKDLAEISIQEYAESLIDSLVKFFDPDKNITVKTHIADFEVDAKKAVSIGIIINELLTNAFKYAFKDRDNGKVSLSITEEKNTVTLTIHDNGVGIDERTMENESPGFGLTIVKMLVEQLEGTFTMENHQGTRSTLKFDI